MASFELRKTLRAKRNQRWKSDAHWGQLVSLSLFHRVPQSQRPPVSFQSSCTKMYTSCAWMIANSDSHRPLPADSSPAVLVCRMSRCVHQSRSLTPVNSLARSLWSRSTGNSRVLSRMYTSCTARTTSLKCLLCIGTAKVRLRTSTSWSSATFSFQNWSFTSHQRISAAVSSSNHVDVVGCPIDHRLSMGPFLLFPFCRQELYHLLIVVLDPLPVVELDLRLMQPVGFRPHL